MLQLVFFERAAFTAALLYYFLGTLPPYPNNHLAKTLSNSSHPLQITIRRRSQRSFSGFFNALIRLWNDTNPMIS